MLIVVAVSCTILIFGSGYVAGRLDRDVNRVKVYSARDIMKMLEPEQVSAMQDRRML